MFKRKRKKPTLNRSQLTCQALEVRQLLAADIYGSSVDSLREDSDTLYSSSVLTAFLPDGLSRDEFAATLGDAAFASSTEQEFAGFLNSAADSNLITQNELEPNNTLQQAQLVPLGFGQGQDTSVRINGSSNSFDLDVFRVDLNPGDVLGAAVTSNGSPEITFGNSTDALLFSSADANSNGAASSPMPQGDASLAWVTSVSDSYFVIVESNGSYQLDLVVSRPGMESLPAGTTQKLFLDFDGATIDAGIFPGGNGQRSLSPLSSFLGNWGLSQAQESQVIDAVIAAVTEDMITDVLASGFNNNAGMEILNSRDHADPWGQPNVSRIIVGGTVQELGIQTIGIAESLDVGNFDSTETGVVLLDLLSSNPNQSSNSILRYVGPQSNVIDAIGRVVGTIVSHEVGHYVGSYHTDNSNNVPNTMDQGGNAVSTYGVGPDLTFGTADDVDVDFGFDTLTAFPFYQGLENTMVVTAWGLSKGLQGTGGGGNPRFDEPFFFTAKLGNGQRELHFSDGSVGGTSLVKNLAGSRSAAPRDITPVGSRVFFSAALADGQRELYRSDGTAQGTFLVRNLSGDTSSNPLELVKLGNRVLFTARQANNERELFISNGTSGGTVRVSNLSGTRSSNPQDLTAVGNRVFFTALTGTGERELWVTQGTASSTRLVRNLFGTTPANPKELTFYKNRLFFTAINANGKRELWESNGTASGTKIVKDLSGILSSHPEQLTVAGNKLYFSARIAGGQRELHVSDGTAAGTTLVRNLSGTTNSDPKELTRVGNRLFFTAELNSGQRELFVSDGTSAGTQMVRNLSGTNSSDPKWLTAVGNQIAFSAKLANGQRELFRSDGTSQGTEMVRNLSGTQSAALTQLTAVDTELVFSAILANGQRETHFSDLTSNGTQLFRNLAGTASSEPADFAVAPTLGGGGFHIHPSLDIDGDGFTSPIDALLVVNYLNNNQELPEDSEEFLDIVAMDVNGDGNVSPIDALSIINHLSNDYLSHGHGCSCSLCRSIQAQYSNRGIPNPDEELQFRVTKQSVQDLFGNDA